jgi:hypothetical protein
LNGVDQSAADTLAWERLHGFAALVRIHRQGVRGYGFAGEGPVTATSITIEIVRKSADQIGFAVTRADGWSNASSPG